MYREACNVSYIFLALNVKLKNKNSTENIKEFLNHMSYYTVDWVFTPRELTLYKQSSYRSNPSFFFYHTFYTLQKSKNGHLEKLSDILIIQ